MRIKKLVINECGTIFSLYPNGQRVFDDTQLLALETGAIKGIPDDRPQIGVPQLVYDAESDLFQKIQLRDNTDYEFAIELPIGVNDYLVESEKEPLFPFSNTTLKDVIRFNGPDSCTELPGGRYRITGRMNFESQAGTAHLDIEAVAGDRVEIPVEVMTQKLDYHREFRQLLHQISEYSAELLINFDCATETAFGVSADEQVSSMAELMAYRRFFREGRLTKYIREIINNPSKRTFATTRKEISAFASDPDWTQLAQSAPEYDFLRGGVLKDIFSGYTPLTLPEKKIVTTWDTADNRFIKSTLQILRARLEKLKEKIPKKYASSRTAMQLWSEELDSILLNAFWTNVGNSVGFPNSMILATRKGYREYLTLFLAFGMSLKLETETTLLSDGGDIKPVFLLYEIWCYLIIHTILCNLTSSSGTPELAFANRDREFLKDLVRKNDQPVRFVYIVEGRQINIQLYYNKDFTMVNDRTALWADSYSGIFNPDISIAIEMDDVIHWLHFDAKYRLDLGKWRAQLLGAEETSSFKREDIHKMHTYRDALLGTRGSYILYPGRERINEIHIRNPSKAYRDANLIPSVGAFPLKPDSTGIQAEQVDCISSHIKSCIDALVANNFSYQEESGLI